MLVVDLKPISSLLLFSNLDVNNSVLKTNSELDWNSLYFLNKFLKRMWDNFDITSPVLVKVWLIIYYFI